jgi:hypothetical protein
MATDAIAAAERDKRGPESVDRDTANDEAAFDHADGAPQAEHAERVDEETHDFARPSAAVAD